ncbi:MAG: helix-turn-helix domain-containing protein [Acidimicrobiia bacterium]|nr:helix-turn-helix domain-containing protein [Acidimicrobiia bacterium]
MVDGQSRSGPSPSRLAVIDAAVHRFLVARSLTVLRWSVGAVFLYFGALKFFPGLSPAEDLVMQTFDALTFQLVPGRAAVVFTAGVECALGVILLSGQWLRAAVSALGVQLLGILAPLLLFPGRLFDGPRHAPTLEGQYVLKDVILLAAGMVLAATLKGGRLVRGPRTARPTAPRGEAGSFSTDEKLRVVLEAIRDDRDITEVAAEHRITPDDVRRWVDELLAGATATMSPPERPNR